MGVPVSRSGKRRGAQAPRVAPRSGAEEHERRCAVGRQYGPATPRSCDEALGAEHRSAVARRPQAAADRGRVSETGTPIRPATRGLRAPASRTALRHRRSANAPQATAQPPLRPPAQGKRPLHDPSRGTASARVDPATARRMTLGWRFAYVCRCACAAARRLRSSRAIAQQPGRLRSSQAIAQQSDDSADATALRPGDDALAQASVTVRHVSRLRVLSEAPVRAIVVSGHKADGAPPLAAQDFVDLQVGSGI